MLASICRKVLIALTSMGMVTRVRITVAMPPATTLATSMWAITEGSTEVAGITKSGFLRDHADGSLSARYEHTIVITDGEPVLLTAA